MSNLDTPSPDGPKAGVPAVPNSDEATNARVLAAYKQMLVSLFFGTLIVVVIVMLSLLPFFYIYYYLGQQPAHEPPLLLIVALSGSLGAFFSALIRLYNFEELPKALVERTLQDLPKGYLRIYSLVPALVGTIAATVLYVVFASGLMQGDLFPHFACKLPSNNNCSSFGKLIGDWSPDEAEDYAKAIVWGFVAGFAERFVPDTLRNLVTTNSKRENNRT